jgi:PhnB protein
VLDVGDAVLMGSDAASGRYEEPKGFSVSTQLKVPADAERIFRALAEKGTVRMPLQKTFWAQRFGMLVDRFGVPWMVNCE